MEVQGNQQQKINRWEVRVIMGRGAKAMVRKMGKALNPRGSIETRQKAPLPGDGKVRSRIKNGDKISKRFRTQAANGKLVL